MTLSPLLTSGHQDRHLTYVTFRSRNWMVTFYFLCVQESLLNNDGTGITVLLCRGSVSMLLLHCSKWKFYHLLKFKDRSTEDSSVCLNPFSK